MDGLIYEMIRGSSDFLVAHPDPELQKQVDGYVQRIVTAAPENPNGYVNTYTQLVEPDPKGTPLGHPKASEAQSTQLFNGA